MKDKLIDLLGGLPFFLMATDGKYKPNKARLIEGAMIPIISGVVMYLLLSYFALPSAVKDVKSQLNYIEKSTMEIKTEVKDMRQEYETIKADVVRIDAIQKERIRRENRGR